MEKARVLDPCIGVCDTTVTVTETTIWKLWTAGESDIRAGGADHKIWFSRLSDTVGRIRLKQV